MSVGNRSLQPLPATPTTPVSTTALPQPITTAPETPVEVETLADASGTDPLAEGQEVETALIEPAATDSSADVTEDDLIGAWSASTPTATCSINLSLTNWTGGFRASTRNCGDVQLATLSAWSVEGRQVILRGTDGEPLGRLFRTGETRYAGQLETGQALTVFR
ncbi:MAG: AprI/Inh family metalloprotease inhibitor [Devosiaceae bacterium]|nr:AprI/Inh family metalloprotease inhibitor [Devosiaceae bacterium MH13]